MGCAIATAIRGQHLLIHPRSFHFDLREVVQDLECNVLCKIAHLGKATRAQKNPPWPASSNLPNAHCH